MIRPSDFADWATDTVNNGRDSTPNKVQPTPSKVLSGWGFPEKPARGVFNYWMNNVGQWVRHFLNPSYISLSNGQSAVAGDRVIPDNSAGSVQINLPDTQNEGDTVRFRQRSDTLWSTNNLLVNPVNSSIEGDGSVMTVDSPLNDNTEFELYHDGSTWRVHVTKTFQ